MSARTEVADFWDRAISDWIEGRPEHDNRLKLWRSCYSGKGRSAVDLAHYPDPYTGDLRGVRREPRIVALGINPGEGHDELQGKTGIWTDRIRQSSYSECLERFPRGDSATWLKFHNRQSPYWRNLVYFGRRWLGDEAVDGLDFLNFEIYPWHSIGFAGRFAPQAEIIQQFVLEPAAEVDVPYVFAFGARWFEVARALDLDVVKEFSTSDLGSEYERMAWRLALFRLSPTQLLVVSSQLGSGNPPGADRIARMRSLLSKFGGAG